MKIELDKILRIKSKSMEKIAKKIINAIKSDASQGIMQNGKSGLKYRSKQYIKYKANAMQRFTADKIKTDHSRGIKYKGKRKLSPFAQTIAQRLNITKGAKLKAYKNKSVNTETTFVNLTLTGDMLKGLSVHELLPLGFEIGWLSDQAGKVLGNKRYGYDIIGLNEKNQELFIDLFLEEVTEPLQDWAKQEIKIIIK